MRFRVRLSSGLALAFLAACAETGSAQVGGNFRNIQGNAVSTHSISWLWTGTGGAVCYRVLNSETGANIGFPTEPAFLQTGLTGNTSHSIRVDVDMSAPCSAGDGTLSDGPTIYSYALQPTVAAIPLTNRSNFGVMGNWTLQGSNGPNTLYVTRRVKLSDSTTSEREDRDQLFSDFNTAEPNTSYRLETTAVNGDNLPAVVDRVYVTLGTTTTFVNAPTNPSVTSNTPGTLGIAWQANQNPSDTEYRVRYSTTGDFGTHSVVVHDFGSGFTSLATTLGGLLTGVPHTIQITPRNRVQEVGTGVQLVATTSNGGGPAGTVSATVPAGGALSTSGSLVDGNGNTRLVSVNVPIGTFSRAVTLLISTRAPAAIPGYVAACGAIDAVLSVTPSPPDQPAKPVVLSYSVPQALVGGSTSRATLMRFDPFSGACVPLKTSVSVANGLVTVTALTAHFSDFGVQLIAPSGALSQARAFPNPFYVRRQGLLTIDRLLPSTRVRIYTLKGEEVFDETASAAGIVVWTGNNKRGLQVASGVFLVSLQAPGVHHLLKVVVLR